MKNLLLILLLANILYFLWGWVADDEPASGVAIVDERDLGPPLIVKERDGPDSLASVGAVLGSEEPTTLAAVVGRSCVTIGPLRGRSDADAAQTRYRAEGMRTGMRKTFGKIFIGHWVQIRSIPSREEGDRMLAELHANELQDAYLVQTDDEGLKISLGLFSEMDRAEKMELQAQSLGLSADITPRMQDGEVFFVDVALPPGRGASEIIERYGEEQVMLRQQATCPPD